jgi:hypothetical protein
MCQYSGKVESTGMRHETSTDPQNADTRAELFSINESRHDEPSLFGVTDGKAVGTYIEHKFVASLMDKHSFARGNSASGIDFPSLAVDIKTTSIKQPQSSCPFKSASQKIFGLGYSLLVFVYEKTDTPASRTSKLYMRHTIFIDKARTADYQTTRSILEILNKDGNEDDLVAFMLDRHLPMDEIEAHALAGQVLKHKPKQGFLTISNALQWRLQYSRVIEKAGSISGLKRIASR